MQRYRGVARRVQPVTQKQAMNVLSWLRGQGNARNTLLWALGISTGLRISDMLRLRVGDLLDADGEVATSIEVRETKTGKTRLVRLMKVARDAYMEYCREADPAAEDPLFPSRDGGKAITREQARRLVKKWCAECNLRGDFGTHTLRKTFATIAYDSSGHDPVATARLTGHANPSQLLRYIGRATKTEENILRGMEAALSG